jgi:SAM-dependent methyltransferase
MVSVIKKGYRRLLPLAVRAKLWRLRERVHPSPEDSSYLSVPLPERCDICGEKNLEAFREPERLFPIFKFYQCQNCEYIFVFPAPDTPSIAYYEELTMPEFGEGEGTWNGHYLEAINANTSSKGRLLEIGFGNASFLKLAHDDGWETYGTELSVPLFERARTELNLPNIGLGTIETLNYDEGFFDVVCGFNFLEHVPDPRKTLGVIHRLLRPGGLIAVMCPNLSGIFHLLMPEILGDNDPLKITWCPPDHISYFNKTNLAMLLESVGFTDIKDESHGMSSLWRQFEPQIGPDVTTVKLSDLAEKIRSSSVPKGDARLEEYREEIKKRLVERMAWTMVSDLIQLEPLLGAEVGILFVARKKIVREELPGN